LGQLDLSFLDENQESLPDESRSGDLLTEGIDQDLVVPENIDLPVGGSSPGTGSGQLVNDHDNADFGEMDQTNDIPIHMVTVGVFAGNASIFANTTYTNRDYSPNNALLQNTSTVGDTGRRVNFDDRSSSQESQPTSVVLPSGRHNVESNAVFTNPHSTSNSSSVRQYSWSCFIEIRRMQPLEDI
jgi:hypothetical protein